jgi:hypothetical protein
LSQLGFFRGSKLQLSQTCIFRDVLVREGFRDDQVFDWSDLKSPLESESAADHQSSPDSSAAQSSQEEEKEYKTEKVTKI